MSIIIFENSDDPYEDLKALLLFIGIMLLSIIIAQVIK